jgi:hypothetical protein
MGQQLVIRADVHSIAQLLGTLKTLLMPLIKAIKTESLPGPLNAQCLEVLKTIKDLNRSLDEVDSVSSAQASNASGHPGSLLSQQLLRLTEATVADAACTGQAALILPDALQLALYASATPSRTTLNNAPSPAKLSSSGSSIVPLSSSPLVQPKLTSSGSNVISSSPPLSALNSTGRNPLSNSGNVVIPNLHFSSNNPNTFHPPLSHAPPGRTASKTNLTSNGGNPLSPKPLARSTSNLPGAIHSSGATSLTKSNPNLSIPNLANLPNAPNNPLSPKSSAALAQFAKQESYLLADLKELRLAWIAQDGAGSGVSEKEARREILGEAQATLKRMGATVKQITKTLAKDKERRKALKTDFAQLTRFYASVAAGEAGEKGASRETLILNLVSAMQNTLAAISNALKMQADLQPEGIPSTATTASPSQPSPHKEREPTATNQQQQQLKVSNQANPVKLLEESIRLNLRHVLQGCLASDTKKTNLALTHLEKIVREIRQFLRHAPSCDLSSNELDTLIERMRDDLLKQCKALRACVDEQQIVWEREGFESESLRLAKLRGDDNNKEQQGRESQGTGPTGAAVREFLLALRSSCLNYYEVPSELPALVRASLQQLFGAYLSSDLAAARAVLHSLGKHTIELRKALTIPKDRV